MKKILTGLLVTAGLLSVSFFIKTDSVSAHGYVHLHQPEATKDN